MVCSASGVVWIVAGVGVVHDFVAAGLSDLAKIRDAFVGVVDSFAGVGVYSGVGGGVGDVEKLVGDWWIFFSASGVG